MEYIVWPLTVLVIAILFMLIFRSGINNFLNRVKSIDRLGITTNQEKIQKTRDKNENAVDDLMKAYDSILLRENEARIMKDLEERGINQPDDKIKILTRHLAAAQLIISLERVDYSIWGSQIAILEFLNANPNGTTKEILETFYMDASVEYPRTYNSYSFEAYLNFLIKTFPLIIKKEGLFYITQFGQEFLGYLTRTMRPGSQRSL